MRDRYGNHCAASAEHFRTFLRLGQKSKQQAVNGKQHTTLVGGDFRGSARCTEVFTTFNVGTPVEGAVTTSSLLALVSGCTISPKALDFLWRVLAGLYTVPNLFAIEAHQGDTT